MKIGSKTTRLGTAQSTLHLRSESGLSRLKHLLINFISVENLPSEMYQIFFFPSPELHVAAHMWNISDIKPPNWKNVKNHNVPSHFCDRCSFAERWRLSHVQWVAVLKYAREKQLNKDIKIYLNKNDSVFS